MCSPNVSAAVCRMHRERAGYSRKVNASNIFLICHLLLWSCHQVFGVSELIWCRDAFSWLGKLIFPSGCTLERLHWEGYGKEQLFCHLFYWRSHQAFSVLELYLCWSQGVWWYTWLARQACSFWCWCCCWKPTRGKAKASKTFLAPFRGSTHRMFSIWDPYLERVSVSWCI